LPLVVVSRVGVVPRAMHNHHHPRGNGTIYIGQVLVEPLVLNRLSIGGRISIEVHDVRHADIDAIKGASIVVF